MSTLCHLLEGDYGCDRQQCLQAFLAFLQFQTGLLCIFVGHNPTCFDTSNYSAAMLAQGS